MPNVFTIAPRTWTTGEVVTGTRGNTEWRDPQTLLYQGPTFYGNDPELTCLDGVEKKVDGMLATADPFEWWDVTTDKLTPTTAGIYLFTMRIAITGGAAGANVTHSMVVRQNGSTRYEHQEEHARNTYPGLTMRAAFYMNGTTDYVEFLMTQRTGATDDVPVYISATRIGS